MEDTQIVVIDQCNCHDCIQFGLSTHPVDVEAEERQAYTTKTYGSYSIVKPCLSNRGQYTPDLLKVG